MKAMMLAAGLGTRLAPLTEIMPKPCVPVVNIPAILYGLKFLQAHGATEVLINQHHLGGYIQEMLGEGGGALPRLHYRHEPEILGTGGAIKNAEDFFAGEDAFVVANADALYDFDLTAALAEHRAAEATATMVLNSKAPLAEYGSVDIDMQGRVRNIGGRLHDPGGPRRAGVFTGVHILSPAAFEYMPPGVESCVNAYVYPRLIDNGEIVRGAFMDGLWQDLGTLEHYYQANMRLLDGRARLSYFDPFAHYPLRPRKAEAGLVVMGDNVTLGDRIRIAPPVVLGHGVHIGSDCAIGPYAILGDHSAVGDRCEVMESIVFDAVKIPNRKRVVGRVVTPRHRVEIPSSAAATESVSVELELSERETASGAKPRKV